MSLVKRPQSGRTKDPQTTGQSRTDQSWKEWVLPLGPWPVVTIVALVSVGVLVGPDRASTGAPIAYPWLLVGMTVLGMAMFEPFVGGEAAIGLFIGGFLLALVGGFVLATATPFYLAGSAAAVVGFLPGLTTATWRWQSGPERLELALRLTVMTFVGIIPSGLIGRVVDTLASGG